MVDVEEGRRNQAILTLHHHIVKTITPLSYIIKFIFNLRVTVESMGQISSYVHGTGTGWKLEALKVKAIGRLLSSR